MWAEHSLLLAKWTNLRLGIHEMKRLKSKDEVPPVCLPLLDGLRGGGGIHLSNTNIPSHSLDKRNPKPPWYKTAWPKQLSTSSSWRSSTLPIENTRIEKAPYSTSLQNDEKILPSSCALGEGNQLGWKLLLVRAVRKSMALFLHSVKRAMDE